MVIIVLGSGCAGDEIYLIIEDLPDTTEIKDTTSRGYVYFTASVAGRTSGNDFFNTRTLENNDTILLPQGRHVTIYYNLKGSNTYTYYNHYIADKAGYLTAVYNEIALSTDTFNFYAVSELLNSSDKTPAFPQSGNGIATDLYNGLDYLWYAMEDIVITQNTPQTIPIVFDHVASAIEIEFTVPSTDIMDTIYAATIGYPSTSGYEYILSSGTVGPSKTFGNGARDLLMDSIYGALVMIPFDASNYVHITGQINPVVNGDNIGWWNYSLPLPDGKEFLPGYIYDYIVLVDKSTTSTRSSTGILRNIKRMGI